MKPAPCAHLAACPTCSEWIARARDFVERVKARPDAQPCPLSERQLQIIALLAAGLTKRQAGEQLYLAEDTIRTHVARAVTTTGVKGGVVGLVALAVRCGWIP